VTSLKHLLLPACMIACYTGCSSPAPVQPAENKAPAESTAFRIYVTNEVSGDMTVIDSATYNVIATVPLGKRPGAFTPVPIERRSTWL